MPVKLFVCLCLSCAALALGAVITEDSASANSLSGVTLLSESVSDLALSPTVPAAGVAFSYHFPYGIPACGVYSVNSGVPLGPFIASAGAAFLEQDDYRWQDYHAGLAFHYHALGIGYSEHLIYERVGAEDSFHTWTGNLALSFRGDEYGTEIKLMHLGEEDVELHLTASSILIEGICGASTYVYAPHGQSGYRFASAFDIGRYFRLQMSWQNKPPRFGAGLKFRVRSGELMYSIRSHAELNLSHSLDLAFHW